MRKRLTVKKKSRREVVCLSLGSNIGNRKKNLLNAILYLKKISETAVKKASSIYECSPIGPKQREFLNNAVVLQTALSPIELLTKIKKIEEKMGRKKTFHWGPRIIDIDMISYGRRKIHIKNLSVPHPDFQKRKFVLIPLSEIVPHLKIVGFKKSVSQILSELTEPSQKVRLFLR